MPHLSRRSPLPLHWAAFKKGVKKKGEEDGNGDSVASPSAPPLLPLPLPSTLHVCAFQSNTSRCCCTLPDAAQGGWWRWKNPPQPPPQPPPTLRPSLSLVECSGFHGQASRFLLYPQPSPRPQPFTYGSFQEESKSRGAKLFTSSEGTCKPLLSKIPDPSIGARRIFSVVCTGIDAFAPTQLSLQAPDTQPHEIGKCCARCGPL